LAKESAASQRDELALINDCMIQGPEPGITPFGYPRFYGTDGQKRLQELVASGLHEAMDLEDLWSARPDNWGKLPYHIFVRRVKHEEKRFRVRAYWEAKLKKKLL
jgi:hypothetical protein